MKADELITFLKSHLSRDDLHPDEARIYKACLELLQTINKDKKQTKGTL